MAAEIWAKLPEPVASVLWNDGPRQVLISADPFWSAFPWELLRFGDGELDHVGLYKALPRISAIGPDEVTAALSDHPIGADQTVGFFGAHTTGGFPLRAVEREAEAILEDVPRGGGTLRPFALGDEANKETLLKALRHDLSCYYFSGHGALVNNEE